MFRWEKTRVYLFPILKDFTLKNFLINCVVFSIGIIIIFSGTLIYLFKIKTSVSDLPALKFSDSYSLNEKVLFINKSPKDIKTLAIGSSMTLNNLHTNTIKQYTNSDSYLNVASWGMSIMDDFEFLKMFDKMYDIDQLIISSNLMDFVHVEKNVDYPFIINYLHGKKINTYHSFIKNWDLRYYYKNIKYAHKVRNCIHDYEYLKYDTHGAVNFKKDQFVIDEKRWNNDLYDKPGAEQQYMYLDSISEYCKEKGIKILFFQSPIRQGLVSKLNPFKRNNINSHVMKVKTIIMKNSNIFVDANKTNWSDSLFVDATHFNEEGAKLFTEFCFKNIH